MISVGKPFGGGGGLRTRNPDAIVDLEGTVV